MFTLKNELPSDWYLNFSDQTLKYCSAKLPPSAVCSAATDTELIGLICPSCHHKSEDFNRIKNFFAARYIAEKLVGGRATENSFLHLWGTNCLFPRVWAPGTQLLVTLCLIEESFDDVESSTKFALLTEIYLLWKFLKFSDETFFRNPWKEGSALNRTVFEYEEKYIGRIRNLFYFKHTTSADKFLYTPPKFGGSRHPWSDLRSIEYNNTILT